MSAHFAKKVLTTVALLASIATATSVFAHAHLKSETPAAGSTVTAPKDLRLVFSEGVEAKFTKVSITADNAPVAVKSIETAPGDQKTLIVTPEKPLTAGKYKVEWHAVSVDTHKSDGNYGFTVGD
ncbi:copper homeostasis periplasmic binding protein CopC [Pseudomonas synxantha]|uniref:Methionine-rich copper-binding protein CopC n=1 Tax=Pseudomonas synxantha TaxID=47883 RepID=A0ACC6JHA8_9PSED|nr:copper homeostasis periplasmic binding protein CopC [Pseudomonas synxantha]MDR6605917.1 methionine-rich copper-binding protein CopC [Pseudomonas synxantha]